MGKRIKATLLLIVLLVCALVPWPAYAATQPTLHWGSRGAAVRLAQRRLQAWGFYAGTVDGVYGRHMYAAIIRLQRKHGVHPDGVVGVNTWRLLGYTGQGATAGARRTGALPVRRSDDTELLARLVSAEAKGEPYEGQVAVAAVILNRVNDPRFPNTIAGVVYQPHAFESISNGTAYIHATSSSLRAAQDALNGWDPSGGAVFFWNPAKAVSQWIWSRPIIKRIGGHVFAR